jgi:hypothetical protein
MYAKAIPKEKSTEFYLQNQVKSIPAIVWSCLACRVDGLGSADQYSQVGITLSRFVQGGSIPRQQAFSSGGYARHRPPPIIECGRSKRQGGTDMKLNMPLPVPQAHFLPWDLSYHGKSTAGAIAMRLGAQAGVLWRVELSPRRLSRLGYSMAIFRRL